MRLAFSKHANSGPSFVTMTIRNRLLALTALLGASSLALTGCVIPVGGGNNGTDATDITETDRTDNGGDDGDNGGDVDTDVDLAGTMWTGTVNEPGDAVPVELELNADGTVDFIDFGGGGAIDHSGDTWSVSGDTVTMSLVYENSSGEHTIDLTGDLNADRLELSEGGIGGMSVELDRM